MPEKMTFGGDSRPCHFSSVATSTELYAQDTFAIQYIFEKYARKSDLGKGLQVGNRNFRKFHANVKRFSASSRHGSEPRVNN